MPKLITYASHDTIPEQVSEIILEHPAVSLRSFLPDEQGDPIAFLTQRSRLLAKSHPHATLSLNMDILPHNDDLTQIEPIINWLSTQHAITSVRAQDIGLIALLKETAPEIEVVAVSDMTQAYHPEGINAFVALGVTRILLPAELSASDIKVITEACPDVMHWELLVQGPLLIQYSRRDYLDKQDKIIAAKDTELGAQQFKFYNNRHGTLMYAHFHRCLLPAIETLKDLSLNTWLIDARGESQEYLTEALKTYTHLSKNKSFSLPLTKGEVSRRDGGGLEPEVSSPKKADVLKKLSNRPQKPGFFQINKTDHDWRDKQTHTAVAKVIEVAKGKYAVIEAIKNMSVSGAYKAVTPDKKEISLAGITITSLGNNLVSEINHHTLAKISWKKGLTPGTKLIAA